jgi:hypothetical protein
MEIAPTASRINIGTGNANKPAANDDLGSLGCAAL